MRKSCMCCGNTNEAELVEIEDGAEEPLFVGWACLDGNECFGKDEDTLDM